MKRLVEASGMKELVRCLELQEEYKKSKQSLRDHCKSIRNYIHLGRDAKAKLEQIGAELGSVLKFKEGKVKLYCEVDYYSKRTEGLFEGMITRFECLAKRLEEALPKAQQLKHEAKQLLAESEKMYSKNAEHHDRVVREYMEVAYPDTRGLLFKLHMKSVDKLTKKTSSKDEATVKDALYYIRNIQRQIEDLNAMQQKIESLCETNLTQLVEEYSKPWVDHNEQLNLTATVYQEARQFANHIKENQRSRSQSPVESHLGGGPSHLDDN